MAKLRVLIADDDDEMRKHLVVLLCTHYQIVAAVTNNELAQIAGCTRPDVIVCDISTPLMEGLAARKKLIAQGQFIPFVFVSRESSEEIINLLWRESSFAFVCRDETSMHLVNAVEAVHNLAIYNSPFYPQLLEHPPENQNVVFIEEETIQKAEQMVLSCEGCNSEAEIPFCEILDQLTGSDPDVTDYILKKPGTCPRCYGVITEKTFVQLYVRK
jgi:DNA-binding NarL/FixJ family response regulator